MSHPPPASRQAGLAAVVAGYVVAFGLTYWFSVRTVTGREFGDAALRGGRLTRGSVSATVERVLDIVSAASLMGALAVVATIALVRLARVTGLAAIGLMVAANGSTWLLKDHLLSRPDLGLVESAPTTLNSLPSGHTTAVFSAVAAVLFVMPHRTRLPLAVAGGTLAVLTAMATTWAGWHRPSDAIAAFLVVGCWTTVAAMTVLAVAGCRDESREPRSTSARWLGAGAFGALTLGLTLVLALDAATGVRGSAVGLTAALTTGGLLVAGSATGVLLVTLRVLETMETPVPGGEVDPATTP